MSEKKSSAHGSGTGSHTSGAPHGGAGGRRTGGKKKSGGRVALIVLAVLAAVVLAVFACYRAWARRPVIPTPPQPSVSGGQAVGPSQGPNHTAGPGEDGPTAENTRKKDFYTFLIVGRDTGGGGNTDTIMLAAYDVVNQQAALMSIPRDTMVNAPWDVKKINTVYSYAEVSEKGTGMASLRRYVGSLVGFEPDFTVTLEWAAVGELVEAIGGVYFDVPFYMHYVDPAQKLYIDQQAGYRLLSGEDAMQVVRWRKNNDGVRQPAGTDGSDLGRVKLQQSFIVAVLRQCLKLENLSRLEELAGVFSRNVTTELSVGNLVWFAEKALLGGFSPDELYTCSMPGTGAWVYSRTVGNRQSYMLPQAEELLAIVNERFNPYEEDIKMESLDIMSVDGEGRLSSSTGVVRDANAPT